MEIGTASIVGRSGFRSSSSSYLLSRSDHGRGLGVGVAALQDIFHSTKTRIPVEHVLLHASWHRFYCSGLSPGELLSHRCGSLERWSEEPGRTQGGLGWARRVGRVGRVCLKSAVRPTTLSRSSKRSTASPKSQSEMDFFRLRSRYITWKLERGWTGHRFGLSLESWNGGAFKVMSRLPVRCRSCDRSCETRCLR